MGREESASNFVELTVALRTEQEPAKRAQSVDAYHQVEAASPLHRSLLHRIRNLGREWIRRDGDHIRV